MFTNGTYIGIIGDGLFDSPSGIKIQGTCKLHVERRSSFDIIPALNGQLYFIDQQVHLQIFCGLLWHQGLYPPRKLSLLMLG